MYSDHSIPRSVKFTECPTKRDDARYRRTGPCVVSGRKSHEEALRVQAVRNLALALEARERDDIAYATLRIARANDLLEEADAPRAPESQQPAAQQQQQQLQ
jgi:hypothetical protein